MFRANVTVGDTNVNRPKKLKQHIQKLKKKGGHTKLNLALSLVYLFLCNL